MKLSTLAEGSHSLKFSSDMLRCAESVYHQIFNLLEDLYKTDSPNSINHPVDDRGYIQSPKKQIPSRLNETVFRGLVTSSSYGTKMLVVSIELKIDGVVSGKATVTKTKYKDHDGQQYPYCLVIIRGPITSPYELDQTDIRETILHEIGHCFDPGMLSNNQLNRRGIGENGKITDYKLYHKRPIEKTAEITATAIALVQRALGSGLNKAQIKKLYSARNGFSNTLPHQSKNGFSYATMQGENMNNKFIDTYLQSPNTTRQLLLAIQKVTDQIDKNGKLALNA